MRTGEPAGSQGWRKAITTKWRDLKGVERDAETSKPVGLDLFGYPCTNRHRPYLYLSPWGGIEKKEFFPY